ncbi:MAG: tyrosine-type recombinase/integrase [Coriobacteriales bacterium]|jgi:integrase
MTGSRIDFDSAKVQVSTRNDKVKADEDGNEFHPFVAWMHYKEQAGFDANGNPVYRWRNKSKTFGADVNTENKAKRAASKWLRQLREDQEAAEARVAEREAEEERARQEQEAIRAAEASPLVPDYVDEFVETYRGSNGAIEESTRQTYRATAKHIRDGFGGVRLAKLTPKMIDEWLSTEAERFSCSIVSKDYRLMLLACRFAVRDGLLDESPCKGVVAPKGYEPRLNALTPTSRDELVNELRRWRPTAVRTAAFVALYMGLREQEICALRWRDVDLKRRTLNVERAIGRGKGGDYEKAPKSKNSKRQLIIPESLVAPLRERRAAMRSELKALEIRKSADEFDQLFVIGTTDGRFRSPNYIGKQWSVLADNLGFVGTQGCVCTFHDLRHSFASTAIANDVDVKTVQSSLGHSSAATTMDLYASPDERAKRQAAEVMDRALEPRQAEVIEFDPSGTDPR